MLIILATYNEIDNLPRLIHQLMEVLGHADILIVDDASPDGTGNWAQKAADNSPKIFVVHREGKRGLGLAAKDGLEWGMQRDYELIATCDADLSHDPNSLAKMVAMMDKTDNNQVGVVLGSRYVEGGKTENWPFFRRMASRVVNLFARLVLGLRTKDNSGAFRVYRSSALAKIDVSKIRSPDFAYLHEVLWRLKKQDTEMIEFPIHFKNRIQGKSKASILMGLGVFWKITKMGLGIWR